MTEQPDTSSTSSPNRESVVSFVIEEQGKRLDRVVRDHVPDLSRTQGQQLIEAQQVTVNGRPRKAAYRVAAGERVVVTLPPREPEIPVQPQPIPLDIIYEDEHLIVVNKPAGMVVHPAPGHPDGTLVNALLAHCPLIAEAGRRERAGIVHRLDKDTSGVLVVAKDECALQALHQQFRSRKVEKTYLALVSGRVQPPEGIIEVPIGRDPRDRQRMAALPEGRYARTRYCAVDRFAEHTLLEAYPYTGRTHQVRVHLSWLGYPVVGDTRYGPRRQGLLKERQFLHAHRLGFTHPTTGEEMTFEAPLPSELEDVLQRLRPRPCQTRPSRPLSSNQ
jgi:23S rRNA pseudouridine1911/1915/1917 synthase